MPTRTLRPAAGTLTWQNYPTTVYYPGSKTAYRMESTFRAYAFFSGLAELVKGQTVTSATLTFTKQIGTLAAISVERHGPLRTGTAYSTFPWGSQPPILSGAAQMSGAGGVVDITNDVKAIAAGAPFYGYRFWSGVSTAARFYVDGWQAAGAPTLTVTYSSVPLAPTNVVPHGKVSVAAPTMAWQGDPEATAVRVQVGSPESDFATLLFDSGWVPFTSHGMNLATQGWSGLADGASAEVRVAQRTTSGDSPWSTAVTITRDIKPAITLTAPGSTSGDTTPVHTWSQSPTDEQQIGYRLTLKATATSAMLFDSGYRTGADTSFRPTAGAKTNGQQVTSRVQVYFPDRVDSPGDPAYAFVEKTWTFNADLTKAPADSLSLAQLGKAPLLRLTFSRADAPDEWIVSHNGAQVDRFSADEHKVNGQAWSWDTWLAKPNALDSWTVTPVVNGVVGSPLTESTLMVVKGAWLVDPVDGTRFSLATEGDGSTGIGQGYLEGIASYTAIDGTTISHSFGMQGLAGTVTGWLDTFEGRTIAEQLADVYAVKRRPTRTLRLIHTDVNVPVRVDTVNPTSDPTTSRPGDVDYQVSYNYHQVGELPFEAP